ncbi:hypothetical protein AgCh_036358 [Apium graveolens]
MANLAHEDLHFIFVSFNGSRSYNPHGRLLRLIGLTVITESTPVNALRFQSTISRAVQSGLKIRIESDTERFVVPGLPDKVQLTKAKIILLVNTSNSTQKTPQQTAAMAGFCENIIESENKAFGIVANSFEGLEPEYIKEYAKAKGKKVWCMGPVSLSGQEPRSVLYVCLGSIAKLATSQLIELWLGLEELNRPFIRRVRYKTEEFDKWISEEKNEEQIRGRGLIIWGWAPQVLMLSHTAIGGFLTHCGWNSTLEAMKQWKEEKELESTMDEEKDLAKRAMDEGCSSDLNTNLLIQEIMGQANA